jgi:negative regulator of flagellin synthesis FlgM
MQIKNLTDMFRPVENSENRTAKNKASKTSQDDSLAAEATGDRVNLSQTAQLYKAAQQAAQNSSGIRIDLVGQIKERVAGGTYEINARKTAEKMLEQELSLWGGSK